MTDLQIVVRALVRATALLAVFALAIGLLIVADRVGENRRCSWLSDHRDTNPYGYAYYCANR